IFQGVREVEAGIVFSLSLPLDFPGGSALEQRRRPPVLAPTQDLKGNPANFFNVHMSQLEDWGDPRYVDVWADDNVTLSLQYSTQWDGLAHVGAEFDADGDGKEDAVYYNGYRAGVDVVGPEDDARGDGGKSRSFLHHLGVEHMAFHGMQGRGVLVDLAHHFGRDYKLVDLKTLQEVMAADGVLVQLGVPLGELWYLHELASWLREHNRSRFLLTAPPLRLPGAVASPLTPIATV